MPEGLETIKEKAAKLMALAAEGSGASEGEKRNAFEALERLLKKHNLTMDALTVEEVKEYAFNCLSVQHRDLLKQVLFYILEVKTIQYREVKVKRVRGKWGNADVFGKYMFMFSIDLTPVQEADVTSCYGYYSATLEERLYALEEERKTIVLAKRRAVSALCNKYHLFSKHAKEGKGLSRRELEALLAGMRGFKGDRWEKPVGHIGELALEFGRRPA